MNLTLELLATPTGRKRWSRDECQFLENAGLLKGRYELLDGEIVSKMGHHFSHAITVSRLVCYAIEAYGKHRVLIHYGVDVALADRVLNWLETDLVAYARPVRDNEEDNPVLLAVEVSDTTQSDDYGPKVGLYARAGVAEYWVLDLAKRTLVVFRSAQRGEWLVRDEYAEDALVAPLTAPGALIAVRDLLPPTENVSD